MLIWRASGQGSRGGARSPALAQKSIRLLAGVAATTLLVVVAGPMVWPLLLAACVVCLGLS